MIRTTSDGILFPQGGSIGRFRTVVMPNYHLRMVSIALARPAASASSADGNKAPGPNNGSNPPISRRTLRRKAMFAPLTHPAQQMNRREM